MEILIAIITLGLFLGILRYGKDYNDFVASAGLSLMGVAGSYMEMPFNFTIGLILFVVGYICFIVAFKITKNIESFFLFLIAHSIVAYIAFYILSTLILEQL